MRKYSANIKKMRPRHDIYWVYHRYGIDLKDGTIERIQQIQASQATIDAIYRVIARGFQRRYSYIKPKKIASMVAFYMLNWAPQTNEDIPFGEIWVYTLDELQKQTEV